MKEEASEQQQAPSSASYIDAPGKSSQTISSTECENASTNETKKRSVEEIAASSSADLKSGKSKRRFVWPEELHKDFILAVFDIGLRATASNSAESILSVSQMGMQRVPTIQLQEQINKLRLFRLRRPLGEAYSFYDASAAQATEAVKSTRDVGSSKSNYSRLSSDSHYSETVMRPVSSSSVAVSVSPGGGADRCKPADLSQNGYITSAIIEAMNRETVARLEQRMVQVGHALAAQSQLLKRCKQQLPDQTALLARLATSLQVSRHDVNQGTKSFQSFVGGNSFSHSKLNDEYVAMVLQDASSIFNQQHYTQQYQQVSKQSHLGKLQTASSSRLTALASQRQQQQQNQQILHQQRPGQSNGMNGSSINKQQIRYLQQQHQQKSLPPLPPSLSIAQQQQQTNHTSLILAGSSVDSGVIDSEAQAVLNGVPNSGNSDMLDEMRRNMVLHQKLMLRRADQIAQHKALSDAKSSADTNPQYSQSDSASSGIGQSLYNNDSVQPTLSNEGSLNYSDEDRDFQQRVNSQWLDNFGAYLLLQQQEQQQQLKEQQQQSRMRQHQGLQHVILSHSEQLQYAQHGFAPTGEPRDDSQLALYVTAPSEALGSAAHYRDHFPVAVAEAAVHDRSGELSAVPVAADAAEDVDQSAFETFDFDTDELFSFLTDQSPH